MSPRLTEPQAKVSLPGELTPRPKGVGVNALRHGIALLLIPIFIFAGCASVVEVPKTFWGSSTRALEEARVNALSKTYACSFRDCYQAVLLIAKENEYQVFIKDMARQVIVLMKIPTSVDTTEVGIFFTELNGPQVKIYISSLSSHAKRVVAEALFSELDKSFYPPRRIEESKVEWQRPSGHGAPPLHPILRRNSGTINPYD